MLPGCIEPWRPKCGYFSTSQLPNHTAHLNVMLFWNTEQIARFFLEPIGGLAVSDSERGRKQNPEAYKPDRRLPCGAHEVSVPELENSDVRVEPRLGCEETAKTDRANFRSSSIHNQPSHYMLRSAVQNLPLFQPVRTEGDFNLSLDQLAAAERSQGA